MRSAGLVFKIKDLAKPKKFDKTVDKLDKTVYNIFTLNEQRLCMTTKAQIIELLRTNDRAICRALVVLNQRQTADEQVSEGTHYNNGQGFRPCHARMGTSMAKFFERNGYLTPKQIAYWRAPMKNGQSKIEIYAGQLLEVAHARAEARTVKPVIEQPLIRESARDVGNLLEERMVLQEMVQYNPAAQVRLDEIKAELDRICVLEKEMEADFT